MSKNLANLLAQQEADVTKALFAFEEKCGFPSEDVRLLAENKHRLRSKIGQLGLDADDTTDEELFHALRARYVRDSQMLDKALGVDGSTKLTDRLNKAIQLVNHCAATDEMWLLKNSVARSALTKNPPKQVAKQMHYRSVASMIKREDTAEIYLAGSVIESANWQKSAAKQLAKLNASLHELRPIRIINLKSERWGGVDGPASHIVTDRHSGAAAIWPSEDLAKASVLCLTLLLLEGMRALNPRGYTETLHELSPALRWWADSGHLISDGEQPVSLNLKDVSFNHLKGHGLTDSIRHQGARSLWNELTGRYQKIAESLSDKIPDLQYNFSRDGTLKLPTSADLVEEYVQAE